MTQDLSAVTPDFDAADVRSIAAKLFHDAMASAGSLPAPTAAAAAIPSAPPASLQLPNMPTPVPGLPLQSAVPALTRPHNDNLRNAAETAALQATPARLQFVSPATHSPTATTAAVSGFVNQLHSLKHNQSAGMLAPTLDRIISGMHQPPVPQHTGHRLFDPLQIKADFPILQQQIHGQPLVWLDNAATTQKPRCVIDAISRFYLHDNSNIHRGAHTLAARATDAWEDARQCVQRFVGAASPSEIIFLRGTTEAINLVAQTVGRQFLRPGDEIVLTVLEHHANIVPWQMAARETGAVIKVVPVDDRGEIRLDAYESLLNSRTKLVSLTHASNSLGTILPVEQMTAAAKRHGALVLIDGAQTVSHMPVNVQNIGCDFFVFSGHKLFAPTGIGALYARSELQQVMPPWQGGGNMIRTVTFEETTWSDPPAKFEAGTPSIADAVGLHAAINYLLALGWPAVLRHEHELLEYGTARLLEIPGLRLIGQARHKVGVLSFVLPNRKPEEIGKLLDQEGIAVRAGHHCAQPSLRRFGLDATVRPSLAIYNTTSDIDRLADAVLRIAAHH